jgi:hypothetical protein
MEFESQPVAVLGMGCSLRIGDLFEYLVDYSLFLPPFWNFFSFQFIGEFWKEFLQNFGYKIQSFYFRIFENRKTTDYSE